MSEATWRRHLTTAGRSIHSQYKPDHAKEWQAAEDRRQQKAVFGEAPLDDTRGLTHHRDSLYRPSGTQPVERKHNCNVKTLAELRALLAPADCPAPTASTHDRNGLNIEHMSKTLNQNPCDVKGTYSPAFIHQHHFGWNAPSMQGKTAHIKSGIPFARDQSPALANLDYSNKIAGKLSVMSTRRP